MSEVTKAALEQFKGQIEGWDKEPKALLMIAFSEDSAVDDIDFWGSGEMLYKAYKFGVNE